MKIVIIIIAILLLRRVVKGTSHKKKLAKLREIGDEIESLAEFVRASQKVG